MKESRVLDCQFGHKYYKQKPKQGKKMWLQGTRKKGCMAHIEVKTFTLYPHYAISEGEKEGLSKWKLRCLKEEKMKELQSMLHTQNPVATEVKYFVSFPSIEAHSGHPIGQEAVHTQKLHPQVAQKILEMVTSGITDTAEVRRSLKYYVDNFLCKDIGQKPHPHDRAFYPLKQDIMNHISMAKRAIDLSTFDQENLRLKVEEWKKGNPTSSFYFRPFGKITTTSEFSDKLEDEQTFLYIHQDEWQRELLTTYGNTITLTVYPLTPGSTYIYLEMGVMYCTYGG